MSGQFHAHRQKNSQNLLKNKNYGSRFLKNSNKSVGMNSFEFYTKYLFFYQIAVKNKSFGQLYNSE